MGEKRYECRIPGCDRRFAHPASRNDHEKKHTGPIMYSCEKPGCAQKFETTAKLSKHKRSHKGEDDTPAVPLASPGASKRTRHHE